MVNIIYPIIGLSLVCVALALVMLFAKRALNCAMAFLGILLSTAAIYGLIGAHFVATIQLVVYAGAIVVLFAFSIMLLNLTESGDDFKFGSPRFLLGTAAGIVITGVGAWFILKWAPVQYGPWDNQAMVEAGGNTRLLAHSLFTQHIVSFESVSIALIIALVGAVTLAKRKVE